MKLCWGRLKQKHYTSEIQGYMLIFISVHTKLLFKRYLQENRIINSIQI